MELSVAASLGVLVAGVVVYSNLANSQNALRELRNSLESLRGQAFTLKLSLDFIQEDGPHKNHYRFGGSIWEYMTKCIQKIQRNISLWQRLVYFILFYFLFSEFPNGIRHFCTTMPWTIWPSLAVLWGVCWMFYSSEDGAFGDPADVVHGNPLSAFASTFLANHSSVSPYQCQGIAAPELQEQGEGSMPELSSLAHVIPGSEGSTSHDFLFHHQFPLLDDTSFDMFGSLTNNELSRRDMGRQTCSIDTYIDTRMELAYKSGSFAPSQSYDYNLSVLDRPVPDANSSFIISQPVALSYTLPTESHDTMIDAHLSLIASPAATINESASLQGKSYDEIVSGSLIPSISTTGVTSLKEPRQSSKQCPLEVCVKTTHTDGALRYAYTPSLSSQI